MPAPPGDGVVAQQPRVSDARLPTAIAVRRHRTVILEAGMNVTSCAPRWMTRNRRAAGSSAERMHGRT
jgi:hypothetical protein